MSTPPPASPPVLPLSVSVFDGLDWDAPPVPVRMLVELPFRLMCEDATYDVDVEGCTIPIQVLGHLVETDAGGSIVSIHDATGGESSASWAVVQKSSVAVEVRAMRTTFAFATAATPGAIRGLRNSCRETLNAHRFARALLDGHVEHINRLINVYRVAASDPYPFEVSAWDVQGCYLQLDDAWHAKVHLIPYLDCNESPARFTKTGAMPVVFAGPEDIRKTLAAPLTAGEVDLQDGWAHFVRGHFADAITSFVTAIEVTLDAAIERELVARGASVTEREERLAKTFNNFDARFSDYLRIAKRAAPGPIVSKVPYIHGLRLRQEFSRTRGFRHKVVHEGLRLSSTVRGPALRVAETTTWLFDWINAGNRPVKRPNHPEKLGLAGVSMVETARTPDGIKVLKPRRERPSGEVFGLDTAVFNRLRSAIDGPSQDVVVFFESALALLKIPFRRKPSEEAKTIGVIEAYDIPAEGGQALALLADVDGLVDAATLESATGTVLEESLARARVLKGLLVVNHQRHLALEARERAGAFSDGIVAMAARRGISIMTAADLWEWLIISRGNDTRYAAVRETVQGLPSGRIGPYHPHHRPVGVVRHYYAGPGAVSIQLDAAESLAVGMIVAIRLRSGLREIACTELQVDRCAVQKTLPGACVGVKLDCPRNEVCLDEVAFLVQSGRGE